MYINKYYQENLGKLSQLIRELILSSRILGSVVIMEKKLLS